MSNKYKIALIFTLHSLVAIASHVFVVLIVGGVFKMLITNSVLGFWEKGLILGITFYTTMYATNHVTNSEGFCFLTDLENMYRARENLKPAGPFTPRFYRRCASVGKQITRLLRKKT